MNVKGLWDKSIEKGYEVINNEIIFSPPLKIKQKDKVIEVRSIKKENEKYTLYSPSPAKPKFYGRLAN